MQDKLPVHKGVYILPNLFTTASLFTGFLALIWASSGKFELAAAAILFSALMDGLDGKVARLTRTSSEFGVQYDSLADLVAFGVAPGFMMYAWLLHAYGKIGIAASFLFAACSALRLARFNVSASVGGTKKFFTGMPTPAAGCTLASFVFFYPYIPEFMQGVVPGFTLFLTVLLAFLMVSRVRYYSFKEYGFISAHPFSSMVTVILLFVLVVSAPKLLSFILFFGYLVAGLVYTFGFLPKRVHFPVDKIVP
jgi:CDP-diacylglycerol--serine O-phosphatidyltransferase